MDKNYERQPAAAGRFYPAREKELRNQLLSFIDRAARKINAIGCILPHAGYIYSGATAGATLSKIDIPENVVMMGPNHTGMGEPFSITTKGGWLTPLGRVEINSHLAGLIKENSRLLKEDTAAHEQEHSLEVELPFLQYIRPEVRIVPIAIASSRLKDLEELGRHIACALKDNRLESSTLILASSDFTHFETQQSAEQKDKTAIEAILKLDAADLMAKISRFNITMCGYAPVVALIAAAKALGAESAQLIDYKTSGEATGDNSSVVGYAGILIY